MRMSRRSGVFAFAAMLSLALAAGSLAAGGTEKLVVANECPITLWIHFTGTANVDNGKTHKMLPHDTLVLDGVPDFGGGRCWAYYHDPGTKTSTSTPLMPENGFVEMSVNGGANGVQNYNISYVDYATLPAKVVGGSKTCIPTIVPVTWAEWKYQLLHGCPTQLNYYDSTLGVGVCLGSYFYCVQPGKDTGDIYCNKMKLAYGYSGLGIYGGSLGKLYDECAGWQRGTFAGDADSSHYYKGPEQDATGKWTHPYNTFAKWVHKTMNSQVYAFANDDHQNQSGFQACPNCGELDITWCPCENGCAEDVLAATAASHFTPVMRLQNEKFIRYALFAPNGRIVRTGVATSMEEVSRALSNRLTLSRGVYFIALYGKDGALAASKRILATW